MSLWQPLYLHWLNIRCCRCFFLDQCIYKALIFIVADALFWINVSATWFSLSLQILLILPIMLNCIYIVPFLKLEDASFANFASTSHVFDNVRMFLIEIMHLQPTLSKPCRYSLSKLRIFNPLKSTIADIAAHYSLSHIYSMGSSCEVNSNKGCQCLSIKALLFCSFDLR